MAVSKELLEILACPKCKGSLFLDHERSGLVCLRCKLLYRIENDVPCMIIEQATSLEN